MGGSAMGGSRKHGSHTCSGRHYARADAVAVLRRIKASDVDQRVEASRGRHACRRRAAQVALDARRRPFTDLRGSRGCTSSSTCWLLVACSGRAFDTAYPDSEGGVGADCGSS